MGREIDVHVGARIRDARLAMNITQAELGRRVGLAHQTIHKFECGALRVCAEHLWRLSLALEIPVGAFFEGLESQPSPDRASQVPKRARTGSQPSDPHVRIRGRSQ